MRRRRLAGVLVAVVLGAWTFPVLPAVAEQVVDPVEVATPSPGPAAGAETPSPTPDAVVDEAVEQDDSAAAPEPSSTPSASPSVLPEPAGAEEASPLPGPEESPQATDLSPGVDDAAQELAGDADSPAAADTGDAGDAVDGVGDEREAAEDEVVPRAVGDVTLEIASASCLGPGQVASATIMAEVGDAGQSDPVDFTVNLLLEDSDGALVVISSASGSVADGEIQQIPLRYVNPGSYQVEVVLDGEDVPSATTSVQPVLCLVVESSCDAVTYLNAEGNPAVLLSYTDLDADGGTEQVELAPGGSLTLFDSAISWSAVSSTDQVVRAGQGFAEPSYGPCEPEPEPELGLVDSSCSVAGADEGTLTFDAVFPADADVSWQVLDAGTGRVVSAGPFADFDDFFGDEFDEGLGEEYYQGFEDEFEEGFEDDVEFGIAEVAGLAVGSYQVVLLEDGDPRQTADATVLSCLDVTAVCDDVTVTNPGTNPAVYGAYFEGDGLEEDGDEAEPALEFELEPGQTRTDTLDVEEDLVLVVAVEASDLDFEDEESIDFGFDYAAFQEIELGQGCAPETAPVQDLPADPSEDLPHQPAAPAAPVADELDPTPLTVPAVRTVTGPAGTTVTVPLADTGGPVGWLALFGGLTLLAGVTLLVGRRRS